jgi:uncharacterized membrane protein YbhN (UPF0104 family)
MTPGDDLLVHRPTHGSAAARFRAYAWRSSLVLAVVLAGLWTATHGVAGVAWRDVAAVLRGVTAWHLVELAGIWLGGLGIYSLVLAAAMPGLGVRRGLLLNLSGSAVANVLPLGGAVATALNWRMARTWGHSNLAFVAFCVLTNALDILTKLVLPIVGVVALTALSVHVPLLLWGVGAGCLAVLLLGWALQAVAFRHTGSRTSRWRTFLDRHLRDSGERIRGLLDGQWTRLLPGSVGYIAAQVALLFFCLRAVGLDVPVSVVLMAAAIERLGTLVPLTPGGTGVAEIGTIAWLVAAGLDPAEAVAGVLLYRIFLVALEIPVGGALLGGWAWRQRAARLAAAAA